MNKSNILTATQPRYTLSEELMNSISHGLGALFGIIALILCSIKSAGNALNLACSIVFTFSIIFMYTMSSLYHSFKNGRTKKVFRIMDHCSIFFLIAGTYTPYTLITLGGQTIGKVIFGIVWGVGILGVTLNAVSLKKFARLSVLCYLVIGWVIIIAVKPLILALEFEGLMLLLFGGIAYTLGAVLYAIGSKKKYFHSVFHIFCLLGSILQFLSIYMYVI